jgi:hypothetical protein
MINYEKFHTDGYGVYKLEDLLSADDVIQFNKLADEARLVPITDETYHYTMSLKGFHNDPEWPFKVPVSERTSRLKKIEELGLHDTQRWYESAYDGNLLKKHFQQFVHKFIKNFYSDVNDDFSNVHHQDAITIYTDGDHTEIHRDGQNPGRLCALLIYLTPEEEYNDSGDLIILGDNQDCTNEIKVSPVRGNVVILDFINHNPFHGVLPVNPDFIRHCYLTFIWNTDKMPENIRPQGYK